MLRPIKLCACMHEDEKEINTIYQINAVVAQLTRKPLSAMVLDLHSSRGNIYTFYKYECTCLGIFSL